MQDVRCFSCNKALGHLYVRFETWSGDPQQGLDAIGLARLCCRRMVLGRSHYVDDLLKYSNDRLEIDESGTVLDARCDTARTLSCD